MSKNKKEPETEWGDGGEAVEPPVGCPVKAYAISYGLRYAKKWFPDDWATHILRGEVVGYCQRKSGRWYWEIEWGGGVGRDAVNPTTLMLCADPSAFPSDPWPDYSGMDSSSSEEEESPKKKKKGKGKVMKSEKKCGSTTAPKKPRDWGGARSRKKAADLKVKQELLAAEEAAADASPARKSTARTNSGVGGSGAKKIRNRAKAAASRAETEKRCAAAARGTFEGLY